jgi:hypothetical protein
MYSEGTFRPESAVNSELVEVAQLVIGSLEVPNDRCFRIEKAISSFMSCPLLSDANPASGTTVNDPGGS